MKYLQLCSLELLHTYYEDGLCRDFIIETTPETQDLLTNFRCVLKSFANGLRILIQVTDDNVAFISLPPKLVFHFRLRLQNPEFMRFTELPIATQPHDLISGNIISDTTFNESETIYAAYPSSAQGAFADVHIPIVNSINSDLSEINNTLIINFNAKRYKWAYYVVTDKNNTPDIEDQQLNSDNTLLFNSSRKFDQNNPPSENDKIARQLLTQYPKQGTFKILSTSHIACQEYARKTLRMKVSEDEAPLDLVLPSPSIQQSFLEGNEVSLYHVVKYFSQ